MWVDFIDMCQFRIYQDFRMGWGALLLGGRLEVIGIGGFLMVGYHKSSAAYANHLKPLCSEDFWPQPIRFRSEIPPHQEVGEMA
jgi:hypothetical protein